MAHLIINILTEKGPELSKSIKLLFSMTRVLKNQRMRIKSWFNLLARITFPKFKDHYVGAPRSIVTHITAYMQKKVHYRDETNPLYFSVYGNFWVMIVYKVWRDTHVPTGFFLMIHALLWDYVYSRNCAYYKCLDYFEISWKIGC